MTVSTEGTATVLPPGGPAAPARPIPAARRGIRSRGTLLFFEALVAFAAALVLPLLARGFKLNPWTGSRRSAASPRSSCGSHS